MPLADYDLYVFKKENGENDYSIASVPDGAESILEGKIPQCNIGPVDGVIKANKIATADAIKDLLQVYLTSDECIDSDLTEEAIEVEQ